MSKNMQEGPRLVPRDDLKQFVPAFQKVAKIYNTSITLLYYSIAYSIVGSLNNSGWSPPSVIQPALDGSLLGPSNKAKRFGSNEFRLLEFMKNS